MQCKQNLLNRILHICIFLVILIFLLAPRTAITSSQINDVRRMTEEVQYIDASLGIEMTVIHTNFLRILTL